MENEITNIEESTRKRGRPPGSKNKVGKSEKEFIEQLLADTQEQYKKAFMALANSEKIMDQRRFMDIRKEMSKMVVPRPTEVSFDLDNKEYDELTIMFNTWDDPDDED